MTPISFTARYIRPANIKKLDGDTYKPHVVSLVEMEASDIPVIERVAFNWMQPVSDQLSKEADSIGKEGRHVYAITNQGDKFEKLNPDNILGMMMFQEHKSSKTHNTIEFLQVNPMDMSPNYGSSLGRKFNKIVSFIFGFKKPEHKHVGQSLLDSAKDMFSEKPIDLFAVDKALDFYFHNGFKRIPGFKNRFLNHLEWIK